MLFDMVADAISTACRDIRGVDFGGKGRKAAHRGAIIEQCEATAWLGSRAAANWLSWIDMDLRTVLGRINWTDLAKRDRRRLAAMQRDDERRKKATESDKLRASIQDRIERRAKQLRILRNGIEELSDDAPDMPYESWALRPDGTPR